MTEECAHNFILLTKPRVPYYLCSKCGAMEGFGDLTQSTLERAIGEIDSTIALKDMLAYGTHITFGGKRVSPEDFYLLKDDKPSE